MDLNLISVKWTNQGAAGRKSYVGTFQQINVVTGSSITPLSTNMNEGAGCTIRIDAEP